MLGTSTKIFITALAATAVACATSACSSSSSGTAGDSGDNGGGLPAFNSIDTSVSCPAGQIGWNYSTGGGSIDTAQGSALAGVQVLTASFGANCNANLANNEVPLAVSQCNGQTRCDFPVGLTYDPAYGCAKAFTTTWQCGSDSTVYSGSESAEATGKVFEYDCGGKITILGASTTSTCGGKAQPPVNANAGSQVSQACNNLTACNYSIPAQFNACPTTFSASWTCGSNPHVYSSTEPFATNFNSGATPFSILCPGSPAILVQQATWGANCSAPAGNLTTQVGNACNGNTSGTCPFTVGGIPDPHYGCAKNFEVKYTCGADPFLYDATYPAEAGGKTFALSCAGSTPFSAGNTVTDTGQKACINTSCPYNQPRNSDTEQCGPVDNTRQQVSSVFMDSYTFTDVATGAALNPSVFAAGSTTISSNWPANLTAEINVTGPAVQATVEPWMTYLFQAKSGGASAEGFLCALTPMSIQTSPYQANYYVSSGNKVLPSSCFDARSNPYADAAARLKMPEAQFRQLYNYKSALLHFSFDTEGSVGLGGNPLPNPPGFFYTASTNYTDYISFYQQREITKIVSGPNNASWASLKWPITPSTELTQGYNLVTSSALEVNLDGAETRKGSALDINFFAPFGPSISEDIHWSLVGDSPVNPLSPTTTNPQGSVKNLQQANLRATVEMYPAGASDSSGLVVGTIPLQGGAPTGTTTNGTLQLSQQLVSQIFGGWKNSNTFSLKTCIDMDGVNTRSGATIPIPDTSIYSGKINYECNIQANAITVNRTYIKYNIATQQTANGVSSGDNSTKGDSSNSSSDASGSEKSCAHGKNGSGQNTVTCTATQQSGSSGGGNFARSLFSSNAVSSTTHTVLTNNFSNSAADQAHNSASAEILGYQVLDQDNGPQNGFQGGAGSGIDTTEDFSISPNWDAIIDVANKTLFPPDPDLPVEAKADGGFYGGHSGIGVGIGFKQQFGAFGAIDINVAIGISVGVEFKWTNQAPTAYTCTGNKGDKCFRVTQNYYTQPDAAKECEVEGGQLANLISLSDYTAAVGTLASWPPQYNIWTGGQENYELPNAACAGQVPTPSNCTASGKTHFDWSDPNITEFGLAQNTSNSVAITTSNIGTSNISLTNFAPTPAGVVINHAGNIHDQVQSQLNYALCQFDAAATTSYSEMDLDVPIGAGAGLNLQYCWPTAEAGVCLLGSFGFIGVSLTPTVSTYQTTLYDQAGNPFGYRGDTNVGIPWNVQLLTGEIDLIAQFLFWSASYKLYQYPGFTLAQGNLASYDWPSQENFQ